MNFSRRRITTHRTGFDMTPMIDVVLLLIIFFMVTSQFSEMVRSEVNLPQLEGDDSLADQQRVLVLDIDASGALLVESKPATREQIRERLLTEIDNVAEPADVRVLLRADRDAPSGAVNRLARDLTAMGINTWRVGTERDR